LPRSPQRNAYLFVADPPVVTKIPEARASFSDWMLTWAGGLEDFHEEMLIVLSELLANAVTASGEEAAEVTVRAWVQDGGLSVEVTNPMPPGSFMSVDIWDYDDPLRPGGRGLIIVNELVDEIEFSDRTDGALVVRCRRDVPEPAA
jgi:anti-sigma regulatory factor (Ser/Thr protein kinase)